jgi:hypothetical protein
VLSEQTPSRKGQDLHGPVSDRLGRSKYPRCAYGSLSLDGREVQYPAYLRWICVRCTKSCRDLPGRKRKILLVESDARRITAATHLTAEEFSLSVAGSFPYVRRMRKSGGRCIFLKGSRCSIYRARPLICRFYPFSLKPARGSAFEIGFDPGCTGMGKGPHRGERFFHSLVALADRQLSSK